MAKCDEGYRCEVCGEPVPDIVDSDLYLRYIIGEVGEAALTRSPERHIRCNPVQAQFIVDAAFEPVRVEGPFDKSDLDPNDVRKREELTTRGWLRLQQAQSLAIPISDYPLDEVRARHRQGRV